jgi:hypothetical protein
VYNGLVLSCFETLLFVYLYSCLLASRIPDHGHSLDLLDRDLGVPFPVSQYGVCKCSEDVLAPPSQRRNHPLSSGTLRRGVVCRLLCFGGRCVAISERANLPPIHRIVATKVNSH